MIKILYISKHVADWNTANLECDNIKLELFQSTSIEVDIEIIKAKKLSMHHFWMGLNSTINENEISITECPLLELSDNTLDSLFDSLYNTSCSDKYHFICQLLPRAPEERFLSTVNLLVLVFLGVFIYFGLFMFRASRIQSKYESNQKKLDTEFTEFNQELHETAQSL